MRPRLRYFTRTLGYFLPLPGFPTGTVNVTVVAGWLFAYCFVTICPVLALIGICFVFVFVLMISNLEISLFKKCNDKIR